MSSGSTSAGGLPRNGSSRSSGGHQGRPSARETADQLPCAVEQQPAPWSRLGLVGERLEEPRLGLRPDSRHGSEPARGRRLAKLVGRADAERARELDRALRTKPEIAAEADEI